MPVISLIRTHTRYRAHNGFALISVVWVLAILGLMTVSILKAYLGNTRATSIEAQQIQANWSFDAALKFAALSIIAPRQSVSPSATPLQNLTYTHGANKVLITISNEAGRIDLKQGSKELIENAFSYLNLPDLVTSDAKPTLLSYRELKRAYAAYPNAYENILQHFTLHNFQAGINPAIASEETLSLLPGLSSAQRKMLVKARSTPSAQQRLFSTPLTHEHFTDRASGYYRVQLRMRSGGRDLHRTQLIKILNQENQLFSIAAIL